MTGFNSLLGWTVLTQLQHDCVCDGVHHPHCPLLHAYVPHLEVPQMLEAVFFCQGTFPVHETRCLVVAYAYGMLQPQLCPFGLGSVGIVQGFSLACASPCLLCVFVGAGVIAAVEHLWAAHTTHQVAPGAAATDRDRCACAASCSLPWHTGLTQRVRIAGGGAL